MGNRTKILTRLMIVLFVISWVMTSAGQASGDSLLDKAMGKVKVQDQTLTGEQPATAPHIIFIQDFELDFENVAADEGVLDRLRDRPRVLPTMRQKNDPEQEARNMVNLMSEALQENFGNAGIQAQRFDSATGLPKEGWLVRGVFTETEEGSRIKRAVIGFGAGATDMEVQVSVSDLAVNPDAPFIIFGTVKDPKQMPGALVTRNPYVAAAKFVLEKNASEKDVKRTAKEIVQEIKKYRDKLSGGAGTNQSAN